MFSLWFDQTELACAEVGSKKGAIVEANMCFQKILSICGFEILMEVIFIPS